MAIKPDPDLVAKLRHKIESEDEHGVGYSHGLIAAAVRLAAEHHGATCPGCDVCGDLTTALSAITAIELDMPPGIAATYGR
jgi:hypothetical protein